MGRKRKLHSTQALSIEGHDIDQKKKPSGE